MSPFRRIRGSVPGVPSLRHLDVFGGRLQLCARNLLALKPALGTCQCRAVILEQHQAWEESVGKIITEDLQGTAHGSCGFRNYPGHCCPTFCFCFPPSNTDLSFPPWFISPSCSGDCSLGWVWGVEPWVLLRLHPDIAACSSK